VAKTVELRPLARDDDRSDFSCGQADLDRFFEHYAGQNQFKLHLAVTYVAAVQARIEGFATVAPPSIERASVPSARLRKRLPSYPIPVLRLARLGVDTRAQGLGIGKALLRHPRLGPCHSLPNRDSRREPRGRSPARERVGSMLTCGLAWTSPMTRE
jgi:GNAT superfamily N-acetyltransferase